MKKDVVGFRVERLPSLPLFSFITIINNISLCFLDKKIPSFIIRGKNSMALVVLIHRLLRLPSPSGKEFFLITLPQQICPGLESKKNEISLFPFTFSLKFQREVEEGERNMKNILRERSSPGRCKRSRKTNYPFVYGFLVVGNCAFFSVGCRLLFSPRLGCERDCRMPDLDYKLKISNHESIV
jgi:hypothetical protein